MPIRSLPFPLPPEQIRSLSPPLLASAALGPLQRVYGVTLDFSMGSLARADDALRRHFRVRRYAVGDYPATLALNIAAYVGEVMRRQMPGGRWGLPEEELYGTPLPFLLFTHHEHEVQINVVEDLMRYLWSGDGCAPHNYAAQQFAALRRAGFPTTGE